MAAPVRYSWLVRVCYGTRSGMQETSLEIVATDREAAYQAAFAKIGKRRGVIRVWSATIQGSPIQCSGPPFITLAGYRTTRL